MKHKTKSEYEDGESFLIDDPECSCNKCLIRKLDAYIKENVRIKHELQVLIEYPNSGEAFSIKSMYLQLKYYMQDMEKAMFYGNLT